MSRLAFLIAALFGSTPAVAADYLLRCKFSPSLLGVHDPLARVWHDRYDLKEREIHITLDPDKVVEPRENDVFWGDAEITKTFDKINIEWTLRADPRRDVRVTLTINRFTGEAREGLTLHNPNDFSDRPGQCLILTRRM
jgi:hypothetical protein